MKNTIITDPNWLRASSLSTTDYETMKDESTKDSASFWGRQSENIQWMKKWTQLRNYSFKPPVNVEWFKDGVLNATESCLDRHAQNTPNKVALIWEPENTDQKSVSITYAELLDRVGQYAQVLKDQGVKKGDRVTLYLPMIPEALISMLACARLGAIHSVVFAGFSPEALAMRIDDCDSEFLITADEGRRAGKLIDLKGNVDKALKLSTSAKKVFVVQNTKSQIPMKSGRDLWMHELLSKTSERAPAEPMNAEDPLFILYTSGSTGQPKGVLHTTGGYLTYAHNTFKWVFDHSPEDTYWCAADIGWITGHSYITYGPLSNGCTQVIFEGAPNCPSPSRIWEIVDKHQVNTLYTAPTLLRSLMAAGDQYLQSSKRTSLRLLGSVGEPINSEAWEWYFKQIGNEKCPIVDTWWQTETGGIVLSPLPGISPLKPGSATWPIFGIQPLILNEKGEELEGEAEGFLAFKEPWPGMMRTVYNNHDRFESTYFSQHQGYYFTGDGAQRDSDGNYWITGRVDDVINVSGHRMGTAEVESALDLHDKVAESAVVGFPHDIKGQGIYAYVILNGGEKMTPEINDELVQLVRKTIGPIATPDKIHFTPALPKTRSGKIMRRILRKIANDKPDELGDTSTLSNPEVVQDLIDNHQHIVSN